jgi:hypothetical protein
LLTSINYSLFDAACDNSKSKMDSVNNVTVRSLKDLKTRYDCTILNLAPMRWIQHPFLKHDARALRLLVGTTQTADIELIVKRGQKDAGD